MQAIRQGIVTVTTKEALEEAERKQKNIEERMRQARDISDNIVSILPQARQRFADLVEHMEGFYQGGSFLKIKNQIAGLVGGKIC